ncbi:MAG: histidine phosphatase family protein [Thermodesulfobacteriota bacterium]
MAGKRLLLVRHADTGLRGVYLGRRDVPLAEAGVAQLPGLAEAVRRFAPDRCVMSPLLRARQTGEFLGSALGIAAVEDDRLQEVDFGDWDGLDFAAIADRDPELVRRWAEYGDDFRFPGGEGLVDFRQRVAAAAVDFCAGAGRTVLAVSHGGVIRTMLCHLLGIDCRNYLMFNVRPASLAVIDVADGYGVLQAFNVGGEEERWRKSS